MMYLWQLFISFARSSLLGFGGGPSMITIIQSEVVDLRGWLTTAELLDAYAFGNTLPGPIAVKLAAFVGYSVDGWAGAAAALLGVIVPSAVLLIAVASLFFRFRANKVLNRFLNGVRPAVLALLMYVVWHFIPAVFPDSATVWLPLLITAAALVAIGRYRLHPLPLIVAGGAAGVLAEMVLF